MLTSPSPSDTSPAPARRPAQELGLLVALLVLTGLSAGLAGGPLSLALTLAWAPLLVLWWRHDAPLAVFVLLEAAAIPSRAVFGANGPSELVVLVAMYTVASRCRPRWAVAVIVADALAMTVVLAAAGNDAVALETVGQLLGGVVAVLLGLYVQSRRAAERALEERASQLERDREAHARAAVDEERQRIARELHDVVAHHVSVMTLQAGALGKHLQVTEADEALIETAIGIRRTGQEAMTELRRLLGVLRPVDTDDARSPQPDLAALSSLTQRMRAAGMPVTLEVEGPAADVQAGMALAVHRIVQEALTNTLRHAGPVPTTVRVGVDDTAVHVHVRDQGPGPVDPPHYPDAAEGGTGRGLVGMRERAALFGGTVTATPHPDGGFEVRAELPRDRVSDDA